MSSVWSGVPGDALIGENVRALWLLRCMRRQALRLRQMEREGYWLVLPSTYFAQSYNEAAEQFPALDIAELQRLVDFGATEIKTAKVRLELRELLVAQLPPDDSDLCLPLPPLVGKSGHQPEARLFQEPDLGFGLHQLHGQRPLIHAPLRSLAFALFRAARRALHRINAGHFIHRGCRR